MTRIPSVGRLSKSVAGGSDVTLTAAEARNQILEFTGTLTANINVVVPAVPSGWILYNATAGLHPHGQGGLRHRRRGDPANRVAGGV
jgi:hypothetical protein